MVDFVNTYMRAGMFESSKCTVRIFRPGGEFPAGGETDFMMFFRSLMGVLRNQVSIVLAPKRRWAFHPFTSSTFWWVLLHVLIPAWPDVFKIT